MTLLKPLHQRATAEDYLRAFGYLWILAWAVYFFIYPTTAAEAYIINPSRLFWLFSVAVGTLMAAAGSITRIDIKMELPGILVTIFVAPVLYFLTQLYYVYYPLPDTDPTQRYALVWYALLPGILLLPRLYSLFHEVHRLQSLRKGKNRGRKAR